MCIFFNSPAVSLFLPYFSTTHSAENKTPKYSYLRRSSPLLNTCTVFVFPKGIKMSPSAKLSTLMFLVIYSCSRLALVQTVSFFVYLEQL